MKIWFSPYELEFRHAPVKRQGALIRIETPDGPGYADCHPWVELGDAPLEHQLKAIALGGGTPIAERALFFARTDAQARSQGIALLSADAIAESHWLAMQPQFIDEKRLMRLVDEGFTRVKIKVGTDLGQEAPWVAGLIQALLPAVRLRLDVNARASAPAVIEFLERLGSLAAELDFVEDPIAWDPALWSAWEQRFGVTFALDREDGEATPRNAGASVRVLKPAVENWETLLLSPLPMAVPERWVVTSYLDHPLGQVSAAWEASRLARSARVDVCGLLSHWVYLPTVFSESLTTRGPKFIPPTGTGFGFDKLLEGLKWKTL